MRIPLAILAVLFAAGNARAQAGAVSLPRNDVTLSVGWYGADYPDEGEYGTGFHPSLFTGVGGGHYWTEHLKTEVEAAWLSRVHSYAYETTVIDGSTAYITSEYRFQSAKVSLAQSYQFGRNAWVHPVVGVGADVDHLRSDEERPAPGRAIYFSNGTSKSFATTRERDNSWQVHPFVKAGFKMYLSERASFTTEWKFGFGGGGLQQALWKSGFGVDF